MNKKRALAFGAIPVMIAVLHLIASASLPSAGEIIAQDPPASGLLYDRYGQLLYRYFEEEDRIPIALDAVPDHLINAVLAIEDREFFEHSGFSLSGIVRAMRNNIERGELVEGGSTITQQLVKNRILGSEKSLLRKYRELVLALRLERHLSKQKILQLYLNQVAWGGTSYGIEAAALSYFAKPASELNLSESAFLAGLLKAPSRMSPFRSGSTEHIFRKRLVLNRMAAEGFITDEERLGALNERLIFAPSRVAIKAPHFAIYVKEILTKRLGQKQLNRGGLKIRSTLNLGLHDELQSLTTEKVAEMFRHRVGNGAVLVTNPRTGEILSMVGGVDYFDEVNDGAVNIAVRLRQPGSSIKPLTYAMALERGKTASTLLSDEPIELSIPEEGIYSPRNLDFEFRGDVTLREALAASRNIPAVNQLVEIGVPDFIKKARTLGINTWNNQSEYRYALTLGSGEVRMIDLAQAFSTFPNLGVNVAADPILEIHDRHGEPIYRKFCALKNQLCSSRRVFSSGVAYLINNILSDDASRVPTFGYDSELEIRGHEVAVKTGTTDMLRDNWAIGYTEDFLAIVWIGNNDGSPMRFINSGELGASTIWNPVMKRLLLTKQPHRFSVPSDIVEAQKCTMDDAGVCQLCSSEREFYVVNTEPRGNCGAGKLATAAPHN
ncbi:MAG: transglycosylase domain-containing protein [Pseudomonadota bacterium]